MKKLTGEQFMHMVGRLHYCDDVLFLAAGPRGKVAEIRL